MLVKFSIWKIKYQHPLNQSDPNVLTAVVVVIKRYGSVLLKTVHYTPIEWGKDLKGDSSYQSIELSSKLPSYLGSFELECEENYLTLEVFT